MLRIAQSKIHRVSITKASGVAALATAGMLMVQAAAWAQFDVDKFQEGAGAEAADLNQGIAMVVISIAMLGIGWLMVSSYRAWVEGEFTVFQLITTVLRGCLVLVVLGFFVR